MEFLDPILDVAPRTVDAFVEEAGRLSQICDDKARIVARRAARQPHHFGLNDHATLVRPRLGGIPRLGVDVFGLAAGLAPAERYHVSRAWVDALKQRRRETGDPVPWFSSPRGTSGASP